ncbi:hypothetical protein VCR6J2_420035 [Vibrio coralliirubri]|nr:hypothetical protein VCR6J2_420035 [Vibrio coralliirubri]CDT93271.1 hypothetical protein VCR8J2_480014 [Vibrio coralliirubri]
MLRSRYLKLRLSVSYKVYILRYALRWLEELFLGYMSGK